MAQSALCHVYKICEPIYLKHNSIYLNIYSSSFCDFQLNEIRLLHCQPKTIIICLNKYCKMRLDISVTNILILTGDVIE